MFETDVSFIGLGGLTQNKHIRGTTKVDWFKDKERQSLEGLDMCKIGIVDAQRMLTLELLGRRKRGGPQRRCSDL